MSHMVKLESGGIWTSSAIWGGQVCSWETEIRVTVETGGVRARRFCVEIIPG